MDDDDDDVLEAMAFTDNMTSDHKIKVADSTPKPKNKGPKEPKVYNE
jgi:hypothetical protein